MELLSMREGGTDRRSCSMDKFTKLKFLRKEPLSGDATGFWFDINHIPFHFEPGQHINVCMHHEDLPGGSLTRTLSIASTPLNHNAIMLATRMTGSPFKKALDRLRPGDEITVSRPQGALHLSVSTRPIVFIAGGMGINPLYSMIQAIIDEGLQRKFYLLYSNKKESTAVYMEYFRKIRKVMKNGKIIFTLTGEQPADPDIEYGRIDIAMLKKYIPNLSDPEYYIAGPGEMVRELSDELSAMGIPGRQLFAEKIP